MTMRLETFFFRAICAERLDYGPVSRREAARSLWTMRGTWKADHFAAYLKACRAIIAEKADQ